MGDDQPAGRGGLRRRLTLAFLLVGLIPAAVAGFIGVRQSLHASQAARLESEERLVALSAEAVAVTLRNGLRILRAAADEDRLRHAVQSGNLHELMRQVQAVRQRFPEFTSVLILDATGVSLANSLDPSVVGRDFRDRDFYQEVQRSRGPYFSPVSYIGAATRVPTLAVATPIWGRQGEMQGVLAGTFTLEALSRLREIAGLEAVPVIAFFGKFVSAEERTLLTQQAVQFVGKHGPVTLNRLLGDLRQISSLAN